MFSHRESADIEHYIHDKSFRSRLILLSLRNSKLGVSFEFYMYIHLGHVRIYIHCTVGNLDVNLS